MHRVLFVCTGNTCRSPLAAAIFNRLAGERGERDLFAESCGTSAVEGLRATPQAVFVARNHGIDISDHRTRRLTKPIANHASLVLTMTGQHWYDATEIASREKVALLTAIGTAGTDVDGLDITDPYGGSMEEYEELFGQLEREIERSFDAVVDRVTSHSGRSGGSRR